MQTPVWSTDIARLLQIRDKKKKKVWRLHHKLELSWKAIQIQKRNKLSKFKIFYPIHQWQKRQHFLLLNHNVRNQANYFFNRQFQERYAFIALTTFAPSKVYFTRDSLMIYNQAVTTQRKKLTGLVELKFQIPLNTTHGLSNIFLKTLCLIPGSTPSLGEGKDVTWYLRM